MDGDHESLPVREEPDEVCVSCPICSHFKCADSVEFDLHKETLRHKYNYVLELYTSNVKNKVKDRHGVVIKISCDTHEVNYNVAQGKAKTLVDVDTESLEYKFLVSNTSEKPVFLLEAMLLHPLHVFELQWDSSLIATPIRKGESRLVKVKFTNSDISYYDVPVSFKFHRKGNETYIVKQMDVEVTKTDFAAEDEEEVTESPFKGESWIDMRGVIYGTRADGSRLREMLDYPIPREYLEIFKRRLKPWSEINDQQLRILHDMLTSFPTLIGYRNEFESTYQRFFHYMLYHDEYHAKATLRHFNMTNVPMRIVQQRDDRVELMVPGLAEKRPSVLRGDIVWARVRLGPDMWETEAYEGIVAEVHESVVWISGFDQRLMEQLDEVGEMNFDIRFMLNRYTHYVQHNALDMVYTHNLLDVIFPKECAPFPSLIESEEFQFFNEQVANNIEQSTAVRSILSGCARPAPYIVFGPPGTGKTITLVEAILQIKQQFYSYILVCAPSNAACDHLAQKLMEKCTTSELLRLHSSSRDISSVPKDLLQYSNASGIKFESVNNDELDKYRIVVCTLTAAARFATEFREYQRRRYHFTHVFIDEAGQAIEPQALVAVGGILGPVTSRYPGGQLVLAGDPKQLGPICSSPLAEKAGLGLSILERLMEHCPLYRRREDSSYDTRYITKLLDNFRSHPSLLELPNSLFYDGELRAKCGSKVLNDPLCSTVLLKSKRTKNQVGSTCVFHAVIGQERQEGKSPSYFNQLEIDAAMRYVAVLLGNTLKVDVKQSEIGIIAPYIRQVYKLKRKLEANGWGDVEVGSTEAFQGREKRVILISTVRSNRNLLSYDKKHKLGFLVDPKRFNVAVTRARSKLIVIGCPHILELDCNWHSLIKYCKERGSFEGCNFDLRGDKWTNEVLSRVSGPANNKNK